MSASKHRIITPVSDFNETTAHYNEDPNFFRSFLDPYMKYTSGLYETPFDSLEDACVRMLDKIIASAAIEPGYSILEIGPGWGSLIKRLKQRNIEINYTGVSPSAVQNAFIRDNISSNVDIKTSTFEVAIFPDASFDAIVMIGSFCHLKDKISSLQKAAKMLKPNGRIIIEDTFFLSSDLYRKHCNHLQTKFVQQEIFGFAEVPALSSFLDDLIQADLRLSETLEHGDSYRRTIADWQRRLRSLPLSDNRDRYLRYMDIFQKGWDYTISNHLLVIRPALTRR